jgi:hypothetical protein
MDVRIRARALADQAKGFWLQTARIHSEALPTDFSGLRPSDGVLVAERAGKCKSEFTIQCIVRLRTQTTT